MHFGRGMSLFVTGTTVFRIRIRLHWRFSKSRYFVACGIRTGYGAQNSWYSLDCDWSLVSISPQNVVYFDPSTLNLYQHISLPTYHHVLCQFDTRCTPTSIHEIPNATCDESDVLCDNGWCRKDPSTDATFPRSLSFMILIL